MYICKTRAHFEHYYVCGTSREMYAKFSLRLVVISPRALASEHMACLHMSSNLEV